VRGAVDALDLQFESGELTGGLAGFASALQRSALACQHAQLGVPTTDAHEFAEHRPFAGAA
jgi:hypothetical protein